jgi:type IV secretory pathway VirB2 component (pilin)
MVKIPISVRIRKQIEKLGTAFSKLVPYADVLFHIGCIYATAIFLGAPYGWKTILFSIAAYFLFFEAASEIRSILSVLSKR